MSLRCIRALKYDYIGSSTEFIQFHLLDAKLLGLLFCHIWVIDDDCESKGLKLLCHVLADSSEADNSNLNGIESVDRPSCLAPVPLSLLCLCNIHGDSSYKHKHQGYIVVCHLIGTVAHDICTCDALVCCSLHINDVNTDSITGDTLQFRKSIDSFLRNLGILHHDGVCILGQFIDVLSILALESDYFGSNWFQDGFLHLVVRIIVICNVYFVFAHNPPTCSISLMYL